MVRKTLVAAVICSLSTVSLAAPQLVEQTIVGGSFGWGGEGFYITIPTALTGTGCATTNQIVIPATATDYKTGVATALAVITGGVPMSTYVDGCFNGRPQVIGMGIRAQ